MVAAGDLWVRPLSPVSTIGVAEAIEKLSDGGAD